MAAMNLPYPPHAAQWLLVLAIGRKRKRDDDEPPPPPRVRGLRMPGRRRTQPPPEPWAESWHKQYVMGIDGQRTTTWARCTCPIGEHHDGPPAPGA